VDGDRKAKQQASSTTHNYNFNAPSNVAISSKDFKQKLVVAPGDKQSLMRALRAAGLSDAALAELHDAIDSDAVDPTSESRPGRAVLGWLGRTTTQIGSTATVALVEQAVRAYFG
jgi:hypothetical protein